MFHRRGIHTNSFSQKNPYKRSKEILKILPKPKGSSVSISTEQNRREINSYTQQYLLEVKRAREIMYTCRSVAHQVCGHSCGNISLQHPQRRRAEDRWGGEGFRSHVPSTALGS
jgi:hypothetical protein